MTGIKEKVQLLGECEKIVVDFCSEDNEGLTISLTKRDDKLISVHMDCDSVQSLIRFLRNPPVPKVVQLKDGRCEKRRLYYYTVDDKDGGKVGVSLHGPSCCISRSDYCHTSIVVQSGKDEIRIGYVEMTKLDIDALIGSLYIWLGNSFLSSRTIHSMFKTNTFQSDKLTVSNIRLSVDL